MRLQRIAEKYQKGSSPKQDEAFIRSDLIKMYRLEALKAADPEEKKNLLEKSMEHARIGLEHFSTDPFILQNAGETAFQQEAYEEASGYFKKILLDTYALDWSVRCQLKLGNFEQALEYAGRLMASDKLIDKSHGLHYAAKAELGLGHAKKALEYATRLKSISPNDPRNLSNGAIIASLSMTDLERYDEAVQIAEDLSKSFLKKDQISARAVAAYARLKRYEKDHKAGDIEKAQERLEEIKLHLPETNPIVRSLKEAIDNVGDGKDSLKLSSFELQELISMPMDQHQKNRSTNNQPAGRGR